MSSGIYGIWCGVCSGKYRFLGKPRRRGYYIPYNRKKEISDTDKTWIESSLRFGESDR